MITNKFPQYNRAMAMALEKSLNHGGTEIYNKSNRRVAVDTGVLKRSPLAGGPKSGPVQKISKTQVEVGYYTDYARYIHGGRSKSGKKLRYKRSGATDHFLSKPAEEVSKDMPRIMKKYVGEIRI